MRIHLFESSNSKSETDETLGSVRSQSVCCGTTNSMSVRFCVEHLLQMIFYSNLGKYLFRKNLFWTLHVPISCTYSNFRFVFWRFIKRENNIIHLSPIWSVLGRIPQNFVVKKLTQKNHPLSSSQCGDCNARWVALSNPWLRSQLNPDDWPTPS
jgi:hypothetical protein